MDYDVQQLESLNRLFIGVMGEIFLSPYRNSELNDLTGAQKTIIYHLGTHGALKMSDIARQISVSVNGATGIVDRLVKMGMVERHEDPSDRRVIMIQLSTTGHTAFENLQRIYELKLKEVLTNLSPDRRKELIESFERIHELLRELREVSQRKTETNE